MVVENSVVSVLEKYVCHIYGQKGSLTVNDARYKMFKLGKCMEDTLPPNFDSLYQHILRVNYEAYIRKRSTTCVIDAPFPVGFGWVLNGEDISIQWSTLEAAPDSILECVICKCKSGCKTKRCSCVKNSLECTELSQCNSCENGRECEEGEIGEDNFDEDISSEDEEDM